MRNQKKEKKLEKTKPFFLWDFLGNNWLMAGTVGSGLVVDFFHSFIHSVITLCFVNSSIAVLLFLLLSLNSHKKKHLSLPSK